MEAVPVWDCLHRGAHEELDRLMLVLSPPDLPSQLVEERTHLRLHVVSGHDGDPLLIPPSLDYSLAEDTAEAEVYQLVYHLAEVY